MTELHDAHPSDETSGEQPSEVRHETFSITRDFEANRSDVFALFADDRLRRQWFRMPGTGSVYDHDFRIGGGEEASSTFVMLDGQAEKLRNRSRYLDITPDRRIVFVYEAIVDDVTRWASLVTVTLADAERGRSTLTWTEQVTFLTRTGDGSADLPHLRGGTVLRLNGLPAVLNKDGS